MIRAVALVAALLLGGVPPPPVPLDDGWILIHLQDHDSGVFDLYLVHSDGSRIFNITNGVADDFDAAVSPDGSMIAVSSSDGSFTEIWVMSADGSGREQVTFGGGYGVTWAPDGSIVYSRGTELRRVQPDGSDDGLIVDGLANLARNPSVSPDGSTVVFDVQIEATVNIYSVPITGGEVSQLTTEGGFEPEWSPDGTRIMFVTFRGFGEGNTWVMNPDGSDQHNLFPSAFNDFQPSWSPDGTKVVFESVRNEDFAITIHDLATGDNVDIATTLTNAAYRTPVWVKITAEPGSGETTTTTTLAEGAPTTVASVTTFGDTTTTTPASGEKSDLDLALLGLIAALVGSAAIGGLLYLRSRSSGAPPPPPPAVG